MFCKKCGTEQKTGEKFCRKCGTQVSIQSSDEKVQVQVNEKIEIAEESNQNNYSGNNDSAASYNQESSKEKEKNKREMRVISRWLVITGLVIFLFEHGISVPFWNWLVIGLAFYLTFIYMKTDNEGKLIFALITNFMITVAMFFFLGEGAPQMKVTFDPEKDAKTYVKFLETDEQKADVFFLYVDRGYAQKKKDAELEEFLDYVQKEMEKSIQKRIKKEMRDVYAD